MGRRAFTAIVAFAMVLVSLPATAGHADAASELFFSEYVEGSSNNKALEIYNGTGAAIDLAAAGYSVQMYFNGAASPGLTIALAGTVAAGDVFVLAQSAASAAILAQADQTNGSGWFNGDDAVVLRRVTTAVDVIGQIGFDPGTEWGSGLLSTADNTLRRRAGTTAGDASGSDPFDPSVEWNGFATDTFDGLGAYAASADLFFSEYIEGTSNNKALEIYNGTGAAIDLGATGYNVQMFFNGSATAGLTINLVGTVAPNDVFVLAHSSASATILAQADQTNGAGWFNGDDAVVLRKGTLVLDVIGQVGSDPGTEWGSALLSTADNTLRRKLSVTTGDVNGTDAFEPSLEWEGFATDTFGGLGSYQGDSAPSIFLTTPASGASSVAAGANITVRFSEAVNVSGNWATITCSSSGAHSWSAGGDAITFTIDPDADFVSGETCTVTVLATSVTDMDAQDPPDNMTGNYSWSFTTAPVISCTDPTTPIHTVQGSGLASPMAGSTVSVDGVVTGDYQAAGGFEGFYVQERDADADADPATSEGIFVFTTLAAEPGDFVRVTGTVTEFFGLTELASVTSLLICSNRNTVTPTPVTLPVSMHADFERYEGMLVSFAQTLTATEMFTLARFGEVRLAADGRLYTPTSQVDPGAPALALADLNRRRSFVLDDGNSEQNIDPTIHPIGGLSASNTLRSGYTTTGLTGVFDYRFNSYRLQPVGPVSFAAANPRTPAPDPVGGNTRVASFNVLNYFNGDGLGGGFPTTRGASSPVELARQTAKEVSALLALDADIAGLMEIENDAGPNSALAQLVAALNGAAGAGTYAYIDTGVIGPDEIKVALIYKPATVTPVGAWQIITSGTDPRFIDRANRPSLAQTFVRNGTSEKVTVVVNHLKSKGSSCDSATSPFNDPDTGDGQGNCNLTRTRAAEALVDWLATDPTGSGSPNVLLIGDLNAYTFEDPISALIDGGYLNLVSGFDGLDAYSYVFSGEAGYLDHALASEALAAHTTGVTHWHINADEPIALDYNTEFKSATQRNTFYAPDAYRSSDHDPVLIGLDLRTPPPVFTFVPPDGTFMTFLGTTTCGIFVSNAAIGTPEATGAEPVTITRSGVPAGNVFPVGTTTITYTATDVHGSTTTATQTVTVVDNTPPQVIAPANVARDATGVTTFISDIELSSPTVSDNCGIASVARSGVPAGNLFPHGVTTITYTATDVHGNTEIATQTVFVSPTEASVCAVVRSYLSSAGIATSMCAKLEAAARQRNNVAAHDNAVGAFVREVNAQRHKSLTDAQADELVGLAAML